MACPGMSGKQTCPGMSADRQRGQEMRRKKGLDREKKQGRKVKWGCASIHSEHIFGTNCPTSTIKTNKSVP